MKSEQPKVKALDESLQELVQGTLNGDQVALSQLITHIEKRRQGYADAMKVLNSHAKQSRIIGVTGAPGTGKSTLVDKLVDELRDQNRSIGVVAVDPSSPFSGGSVLGDRIRQTTRTDDPNVYFRSMSAKGVTGGLAAGTFDVIRALEAFGKDDIIIETVGAGQNEIDIVQVAHTVCVVVIPSAGDDVQAIKAGILEIGDVFAVNKADLKGANRAVQTLKNMTHIGDTVSKEKDSKWQPPINKTVATTGEGVPRLLDNINEHYEYLQRTDGIAAQQARRFAQEVKIHVYSEFDTIFDQLITDDSDIGDGRLTDPHTVAEELIEPIRNILQGYE